MLNDKEIIRPGRGEGRIRTGCIALLCLLLSVCAEAGVPVISSQRVTDVTTRSFSVILTVSEASTAVLSLFTNDCTTPATGFTTTLQQNPLSGNIRISVSDLSAATGYCYQLGVTSTATSQLTTSTQASLTTATAIERTVISGANILPAGNDILKVPAVHLPAGESRDAIITTMELLNGTAVSPLSLLLNSNPNKDYFNLNNLFATATGKTLKIVGSERVRIVETHASSGCNIERFRTLPAALVPPAFGRTAPQTFVQNNTKDIDASGGVNILDVLRLVKGKGSRSIDPCFNSDLDLEINGIIDINDLNIIKGGFNGLP